MLADSRCLPKPPSPRIHLTQPEVRRITYSSRLIMMGRKQRRQGKLFYTSFSLDQRIRRDNPLRKIREVIDFSFVRPAVADKAYGRADNYKTLQQQNITPCIPHSKRGGNHKGHFRRDDFTYDGEQDCYLCPAGQWLRRQTQKPINRMEHMYKIGRNVCQQCPLRAKCYTGKYSKRIYRHVDQKVIDWADTCLTRRRRKYLMGRRRCVVEGSFADSANNHGLQTCAMA